jgi:hypothetical protein
MTLTEVSEQHCAPSQPSCIVHSAPLLIVRHTMCLQDVCRSNGMSPGQLYCRAHPAWSVLMLPMSGWRPSLPDINAKPFQATLHLLDLQRHTQQPLDEPEHLCMLSITCHLHGLTCSALQSVTTAHLLAAAVQHDVATCQRCRVALLVLSCSLWADQLRVFL